MDLNQRINKFNQMKPEIISDSVTDFLMDNGFFTAPASTKHHGAYEGGLFDHSLAVTETLIDLTNKNNLVWSRPESPFIIGMFHDLCKIDNYFQKEDGHYEYNNDTLLKGHGDKSIMLLSTLMQLTLEEVMCIRYHMGAFVEKEEWSNYSRSVRFFPNVLWTHQADMIASQIMRV
jgi:23S rRNA maturation-related 3'-5' exoribonuclease YhaM